MTRNLHVVHSQGEWKVRREGSRRASKVFDRKSDAVVYGCKIGKNEGLELYIHNTDGRIADRRSYGDKRLNSLNS